MKREEKIVRIKELKAELASGLIVRNSRNEKRIKQEIADLQAELEVTKNR